MRLPVQHGRSLRTAPQALSPLGAVSCGAGSHIVPAAFPPAAPRTGLGGTAHVRGDATSPASRRAPRAASAAEGPSTHPRALRRAHRLPCPAHAGAVTVARSTHARAADTQPRAQVPPQPPAPASHLPAGQGAAHALAHAAHAGRRRRVPAFAPRRPPRCPPAGPRLTSAGAALARDGLPADPARLHLLEARHLEGVS